MVTQKELGHIMQHQLLEAKHEQNNRGLGGLQYFENCKDETGDLVSQQLEFEESRLFPNT